MKNIIIKNFNICKYNFINKKMLNFIKNKIYLNLNEIWFFQYDSIFTCGYDKYNLFIKNKNNNYIKNIPIYFNDRGGGIIYHGLGQQLVYTLINLKKNKINIKQFIFLIEEIVINVLKKFLIIGHRISGLHGVYVNNKKICFIGLKINNGCTFYGMALNIKMDLNPFDYIYPCGYNKMKVTQISDFYKDVSIDEVYSILYLEYKKKFNKIK